MKKSMNKPEAVEAVKPEAVKPEAVKDNAVLATLKSNVAIVMAEDGTTRGKFTRLSKKQFTHEESWASYTWHLAAGMTCIEASFEHGLSEEKANVYKNSALFHVVKAYEILAAEAQMDKPFLSKRLFRAWLASGVFARIHYNYQYGKSVLVIKSYKALQAYVEKDFHACLLGLDRLAIVGNDANSKVITDAQQKASDAGKTAPCVKPEASDMETAIALGTSEYLDK